MTTTTTEPFLDLVRRLTAVLERETAAVRRLSLEDLDAMQAEKAGLVEGYEREVRRVAQALRQGGGAALPPEARAPLEALEAVIAKNALTLSAARNVVEGVVRRLSDAARPAAAYTGPAGGTAPVTFNAHV